MIELKWHGPILDMSGYAAAGRGYIKAADVVGIKIQVRDRSRSNNLRNKGIDQPILDLYKKLSETEVSDDCPLVQHQVPDTFVKNRKAERLIGYTIFEMNRVPKLWVQYCNDMHEIWTGSEYSRQSFLNSGVNVPVHILPHAIDVDLYDNAKPWQVANRRSFAFLSVFDFTERKAWRDLLRAYWTSFSKADDVCLILKVFFGDFSDGARADIIRRIMRYRDELKLSDRAPILLYGHEVDNNDMPGLYKAADCYVGISREGFGLSYAEAMAAGVACIGPEVGGTREFMNEQNSYLVKYVGEEPISKEMLALNPLFEGLNWAKHSWEDLALQMKAVVENKSSRIEKANAGKNWIRKNLTYDSIGRRISSLASVRRTSC